MFGSSEDCKLQHLEACTYSKFNTLCSVTMYFNDCEPIFAAASRCDYNSKYYKSKGNCTKSETINSTVVKYEGFYDKNAQVMISTGFKLTMVDNRTVELGDVGSKWTLSQGVQTLKTGEYVYGMKYDRNGIMNFM